MFSPPNIVDNIAETNCLEVREVIPAKVRNRSFNSSLTEAVDFAIMAIRVENDT